MSRRARESFAPSDAARLFEGAGLAAFVWKVEGQSLHLNAVNGQAGWLVGKKTAEIIGREFREVLASVPPMIPEILWLVFRSGVACDLGALSFDGRRLSTHAVPVNETNVALVVSVNSDSLTRAIFQAIPDMMFRIRKDGTYVDFIGPADAPLIPPELFIGKTLSDVLPAGVVLRIQEAIDRAIAEREVATVTYQLDYENGRRAFEARVAAIDESEVIATVRDVTEHHRKREELDAAVTARTTELEAANAMMQELSRRVVMAEDEERRAIAREVHDQSAQLVTALQIAVETCRREVPEALSHAKRLESIVGELAGQFRDLALGLRPPRLDDEGLVPALKAHVDRFSGRAGIPIEMNAIALPRFERYLERTAFRITQEALTNAVRAGAHQIALRLTLSNDELQIAIVDDGRGFDAAHVDLTQSCGLAGMRERALLAGGNIHISSTSSKGTSVRIVLPLAIANR